VCWLLDLIQLMQIPLSAPLFSLYIHYSKLGISGQPF
jgi:hypothetical protein